MVRVQQLETVDALRHARVGQAVTAQADPERVDVRHDHEGVESPGGGDGRAQRQELGRRRDGKGGSRRKISRCLNARMVSSTPQIGCTRLARPLGLPSQRPLERLRVVVIGDAYDVDVTASLGVVEDLLDGGGAIAESRVEMEDRLSHSAILRAASGLRSGGGAQRLREIELHPLAIRAVVGSDPEREPAGSAIEL